MLASSPAHVPGGLSGGGRTAPACAKVQGAPEGAVGILEIRVLLCHCSGNRAGRKYSGRLVGLYSHQAPDSAGIGPALSEIPACGSIC